MKSFKTTRFLEKGYGHFPYIIVRIRSGLYKQIPIHRRTRDLLPFEGIFVDCERESYGAGFEDLCKQLFHHFWRTELAHGKPTDACLVFSYKEGHYISKEGDITLGAIPSGGWLYSAEGELMQMGGEHYLYKI